MLSKCWQQTITSGPCYDFGTNRPDWDQVLQGDREDIMYAIRQVMYGPEYEYRIQCKEHACRQTFTETVNLSELGMQRLSDEDAKQFRDGNRFEVTLDGYRYVYILATGGHLKQYEKKRQKRPQHIRLLTLATRIVEIYPPDKDRSLGRADIVGHLNGLSMPIVEDLRDEFDLHDCGLDTLIPDVECPSCFALQDVELPFDEDFFSPRARKRAAKRRQRISATSSDAPMSPARSETGSGSYATSPSSGADSD